MKNRCQWINVFDPHSDKCQVCCSCDKQRKGGCPLKFWEAIKPHTLSMPESRDCTDKPASTPGQTPSHSCITDQSCGSDSTEVAVVSSCTHFGSWVLLLQCHCKCLSASCAKEFQTVQSSYTVNTCLQPVSCYKEVAASPHMQSVPMYS